MDGVRDDSFTGETIPDITVTDPDGAELALRDIGEPVLLNLWATWCVPCVVEMPLLDELAADLEGDVRVVTVSVDMQGAKVVEPFFEANDLENLPMWMDPDNVSAFAFGSEVLPLTVLYDAEGREVWRVLGPYEWDSAAAREELRAALAGAQEAAE